MIELIKSVDEKVIIKKPHGGVGLIEINKVLTADDTMGNVSLFAHVKVAPHTKIGYHQHFNEAEAYYVIKGEGFFITNDKERVPVKAGDVCWIKVNQGHGMDNPNDEEMEFIALVYPERNIE